MKKYTGSTAMQGLVGEKCIKSAIDGNLNEIEQNIDGKIIQKIVGYDKEVKSAWYGAFDVLASVEEETNMPFHFSDKVNVFALDPLLVADMLGVSKREKRAALQVFVIYYLMVHVLDDLAEDYEKLCSNFSVVDNGEYGKIGDLQVAGASFVYLALLATTKILKKEKYDPADIQKVMQKFMESISIQIRYYTSKISEKMTPEKVFTIKQHCVSGEATAFIADCLQLDCRYDKKTFGHVRKALYYMGSLTQFTDDLRDRIEDIEKNNANLFVSMEGKFGDEAKKVYADWYIKEEELMAEEIRKSKLGLDGSILSCVPWYPYFYNKYLPKT